MSAPKPQEWARLRHPHRRDCWFEYLGPGCVFEVSGGTLRRVTDRGRIRDVQMVADRWQSLEWLWWRVA